MASNTINPDFGITIQYDKGGSPASAFKVLSELINALDELDHDLVASIDTTIKPTIILEDLEIGSIRAFLANTLRTVDDDGLKELEWKKIVGSYLVQGKYAIIKFLEGKSEITNRKDIQKLEQELYELAKKTDVKRFPSYTPIPTIKLLHSIKNITGSLNHLKETDKVTFSLTEEEKVAEFNMQFQFAPENIENLLTKEEISSEAIMILKVKKPDYLGESKWDMRHDSKIIQAKITDMEWLQKFQVREINIRPGDSLKVKIKNIVKYDYNNEVIGEDYEILEVIDIIEGSNDYQIDFTKE